jgi:hypothetical protein
MSSSPRTEDRAAADFVCDTPEHTRSACKGLPFFGKKDGKSYCVLHYPGKEKGEEFAEAVNGKLAAGDFNFGGVWFPDDVDFSKLTFDETVDFEYAAFKGLADFSSSTFSAYTSFAYAEFDRGTLNSPRSTG